MHTNQHSQQQINQCRQIAQQLIHQTQQGNQMYQQMIQQEQQNTHMLEQLLQRERQAVQNLQQSLHMHELAIQRCQQVIQVCNQMEQELNGQLHSFNTNLQTGFIPNLHTQTQNPAFNSHLQQ